MRLLPLLMTTVLLAAAACDDGGPLVSDPVQARVRNDRLQSLEVSIGPATFGTVASGTVTGYRNVRERGNEVVVDGQVIDTVDFCENCGAFGGGRWTYALVEGGVSVTIDLGRQAPGTGTTAR